MQNTFPIHGGESPRSHLTVYMSSVRGDVTSIPALIVSPVLIGMRLPDAAACFAAAIKQSCLFLVLLANTNQKK